MRKWNKILIVCGLTASSFFGSGITANGANTTTCTTSTHITFKDVSGHWAADNIQKYTQQHVIEGYTDGEFKPNAPITRAELIKVINKTMKFEESSTISYNDVLPTAWYYTELEKAKHADYIDGYADGTFKPSQPVTRQEMAVIASKLLSLSANEEKASMYIDTQQSPSWSKGYIGAITESGVMLGYDNTKFKPLASITRAEALTVLSKISDQKDNNTSNQANTIYNQAGTYGPATGTAKINYNVVINTAGVVLQNTEINGDLLLGEGIGEGDVTLKNVKVHGTTTVKGGGEHSIHFEDSVMVTVIVDKKVGTVRIVAKGKTMIQEVTVKTPVNVESDDTANLTKVTLAKELPGTSRVLLTGAFNTVDVEAQGITVQIPQGIINNMNINVAGNTVETNKESSILSLILNSAVNVVGKGTIQNAVINSTNISLEQSPTKLTLGSQMTTGTKVNINGTETKVSGSVNTGSGGSGGSSNSKGSTNNNNSDNANHSSKDKDKDHNNDNTAQPTPGPNPNPNTNPGTGNNTGSDKEQHNEYGMQPARDYGDFFEIGVQDNVISATYDVYATSPRAGIMYLVVSGTDPANTVLLDAAVNAGEGKKLIVNANQQVVINPNDIAKGDYWQGMLIVIDNNGKVSESREVSILSNESHPLKDESSFHYQAWTDDHEIFEFIFNREIKIVDGKDLRTSVTLATYGQSLKSLTVNDKVEIYKNRIIITPENPYLGRDFKFRLASGTVTTLDNKYSNSVWLWKDINSFVKLQMIEPNTADFKITVHAGDVLRFSVNMPTEVYLVLNDTQGTQEDFEEQVTNGWGKKVSVSEELVNQTVEINTVDLAPGEYILSPWLGGGDRDIIIFP